MTDRVKQIYDGLIFRVTKEEVLIKNRWRERDIVHHNGGVGILAFDNDRNQLVLVKQHRFAVHQDTLEIPAGKLESGEEPLASAYRELEEETGYTTHELHTICAMYSTPGFCDEKLYIYWTNKLIKVEHPLPMDEDEEIELCWYDIDEAYAMVERGEIIDAKTIVAIQYAKLHKEELTNI